MRCLAQCLSGVVVLLIGAGPLVADEPSPSKKDKTAAVVADLPQGAIARLGSMRFRKGFFLSQVAFTSSGKDLITAGAGQGLIAWDAATGKQRLRLTDVRESRVFALSPDGKLLAAMGQAAKGKGEELVLYDLAAGNVVRRLDTSHATALAFSADSKLLASSGSHGQRPAAVRLWEVTTGKLLHDIPAPKSLFTALVFAPDGNVLAGCDPYGPAGADVPLWDVAGGKALPSLHGHEKPINSVAFSPSGKLLLSGGDDQTIRVWDFATRNVRQVLPSKHGAVRGLTFSADGHFFTSGHEDGTLALWDAVKVQEIRHWRGHGGPVVSVGFSPDSRTLVSAGLWESRPRAWDVATGLDREREPGHGGMVDWLGFAADGKSVLSVGRERSLLRWDLRTGQAQTLFEAPYLGFTRLAVSPDRRFLALLSYQDGAMTLWDTAGALPPRKLKMGDQPSNQPRNPRSMDVCFSPDGRRLAAAVRNRIHVFEVETGKELQGLPCSGRETALAFSPDAIVLAVAERTGRPGEEATLRFWDTTSAKEVLQTDAPRFPGALTFSPDGHWLAGSGTYEDPIQLWDLTTGKTVGLQGAPSPAYSVAFSPDSKYLAGGGTERDPSIRIWELPEGKERTRLQGQDPSVMSLAFSPDGRTLVSGSGNGTMLVWDLKGKIDAGRAPPMLATRSLLAKWQKIPPFRYPEAKHGKGELKYINGVPALTVRGTPEEIGEQIGVLGIKPMIANLDVPHLVDEVLKSHGITKALPVLAKLCAALFARFPAEYRREVDAMAKASGLDRDLLVIVNQAPDLYRLPGCSTLIVEPGKSATGQPLFGRNLDTAPVAGLYKYSLVIVYHPQGKHAFASIGFPGTVGPMSAINDAGLALATNGIYATADGSLPFNPLGTPLFVDFRRLMEETTSVTQAEKFIRAHMPDTMLSLTICDKSSGAVFELTSKNCLVRRPSEGICACTNHFRSKGLTVTTECSRYPLLEESRKLPRLNVADVAKKLDAVNQGAWTLQSMIFEPANLKVHVAFGRGPTSALPFKMLELGLLFR